MNRDDLWLAWNKKHSDQSATEQRRKFAARVLGLPPRSTPRTEEYYTNDAYLVAATMMEKAAGRPWEECVRELVLEPLALHSVTFGTPDEASGVTVMSGHNDGSFGRTRNIAPDSSNYGKPPFGTPAGFLFCTITDLLTWIQFHIDGENVGGTLLARESFMKVHAALGDRGFGLGWEVETKRDPDGRVIERSIYHGGNTGGFRANMWFCPESKTGTVILYNHAGVGHTNDYAPIFHALLREFALLPEKTE